MQSLNTNAKPELAETYVDRIYGTVKEMSVAFTFKPGERINEGALAKRLGVSRTPLREALNRLVESRLLDFSPGKGFFCRALEPNAIYDLYETRALIESAAVRLACERASDADLYALRTDLYENGLDVSGKTVREVVAEDERFHLGIATLSGNGELVRTLESLNDRIRFVRWLDMGRRVNKTKGEHKAIMAALEARDADAACKLIQVHIEKRLDQIIAVVKEGFSNLYVAGPEDVFERRFENSREEIR